MTDSAEGESVMYEETLVNQVEVRKDVQVDGVKLGVIAKKLEEGEWELSIENEVGARSVWIEPFLTARMELAAGLKAIESEGVESFADKKDLECQAQD